MAGCGCAGGCAAGGCGCRTQTSSQRHGAAAGPSREAYGMRTQEGQSPCRGIDKQTDFAQMPGTRLEPGASALRHVRGAGLPATPPAPLARVPERLLPGFSLPNTRQLDLGDVTRQLLRARRKGGIQRASRPAHQRLARFRHRLAGGRGITVGAMLGANDAAFEFWHVGPVNGPPPPTPKQPPLGSPALPLQPGIVAEAAAISFRQKPWDWSATRDREIGYRTVRIGIDDDFLQGWLDDWAEISEADDPDASYGLVSSVRSTDEALWQPFWDERQGDNAKMDSFLLCWNLPRDWKNYDHGHDPLFWRYEAGPARKVYQYALRLVRTYWHHIEYTPAFQNAYSDGFGRYVKLLLAGGTPEAPYDGDGHSCPLRVRVANNEDHWTSLSTRCDGSDGACGRGTKPGTNDGNVDWWDFKEHWSSDFWCVSNNDNDSSCSLPSTGHADGYGAASVWVGGGPEICLHPVKQAFKGMVCDTIMHTARMAYDYSRYLKSIGAPDDYVDWYSLQAKRIARYALRIMVDLGELFVHELAHFWDQSAHSNRDCFSQVCAEHWSCHVRAHLGLPREVWYPEGTYKNAAIGEMRDDYTSYADDYMVERDQNNGCDTKEGRRFVSECRIQGYGITGGNAAFCATGTITVDSWIGLSYFTELSQVGVSLTGSKSDLDKWCSDGGGYFAANYD